MTLAGAALTLSLHGLSWHDGPGYERLNPGIGLNLRAAHGALHAGVYRNSHADAAVYAGVSVERCHRGWCAALGLAAVTGYDRSPLIAPLPALSRQLTGTLRLHALYAHRIRSQARGIALSLEWHPGR